MTDMVSRNVSFSFHTCVDMFKVFLASCDSPLPKEKIVELGLEKILQEEEGKTDGRWMIVRMGITRHDCGLM